MFNFHVESDGINLHFSVSVQMYSEESKRTEKSIILVTKTINYCPNEVFFQFFIYRECKTYAVKCVREFQLCRRIKDKKAKLYTIFVDSKLFHKNIQSL